MFILQEVYLTTELFKKTLFFQMRNLSGMNEDRLDRKGKVQHGCHQHLGTCSASDSILGSEMPALTSLIHHGL